MKLRFAFDLGVSSLGWSVHDLPSGKGMFPAVLDAGSIVLHATNFAKKAEERAMKRRMLKTRKHKVQRQERLRKLFARNGFIRADIDDRPKNMIPWRVLAMAQDRQVNKTHFAHAILFLAGQRGHRSSARPSDSKNKKLGPIAEATAKLRGLMDQYGVTLFEFFAFRPDLYGDEGRSFKGNMKAPRPSKHVAGGEAGQDLSYDQGMAAESLRMALVKQRKYFGTILSDDFIDRVIRLAVEHNVGEELKDRDANSTVGFCSYDQRPLRTRDRRLMKYDPLAFKLNCLAWVANIKCGGVPVTPAQRDAIMKYLLQGDGKLVEVRKLLNVKAADFNMSTRMDEISENIPRNPWVKELSSDAFFGDSWFEFSLEDQSSIIRCLMEKDQDDRYALLKSSGVHLSDETIENLWDFVHPAAVSYSKVGETAAINMIDLMQGEKLVSLHDAKSALGYFDDHVQVNKLPYYGEILHRDITRFKKDAVEGGNPEEYYGRVSNPTVHGMLKIFRQQMNWMIDTYGKPHEVTLELTRDFSMGRHKDKGSEENIELRFQKAISDAFNKWCASAGENATKSHKLKKIYKLSMFAFARTADKNAYQQRNRELSGVLQKSMPQMVFSKPAHKMISCVFCGNKHWSDHQLASGDGDFEVCHIFPESVTGDSGIGNLIIGCKKCNRDMKNNPPQIAFPHKLVEIRNRVRMFYGEHKTKKFGDNAWDEYLSMKGNHGFMDRHMHATRYVTTLAAKYTKSLFPKDSGRVTVSTGKMTSMLRNHWGLGQKDRADERHHAMDAMIVGMITPTLVQQFQQSILAHELSSFTQKRLAGVPLLPMVVKRSIESAYEACVIDTSYDYQEIKLDGKPIVGHLPYDLNKDMIYSGKPLKRDGEIVLSDNPEKNTMIKVGGQEVTCWDQRRMFLHTNNLIADITDVKGGIIDPLLVTDRTGENTLVLRSLFEEFNTKWLEDNKLQAKIPESYAKALTSFLREKTTLGGNHLLKFYYYGGSEAKISSLIELEDKIRPERRRKHQNDIYTDTVRRVVTEGNLALIVTPPLKKTSTAPHRVVSYLSHSRNAYEPPKKGELVLRKGTYVRVVDRKLGTDQACKIVSVFSIGRIKVENLVPSVTKPPEPMVSSFFKNGNYQCKLISKAEAFELAKQTMRQKEK